MLSEALLRAHMSRERMLRLIWAGEVEGEQLAGRWVVNRASLERYLAARAATPAPVTATA